MSQPADVTERPGAGLAPLASARHLLSGREWQLVERFERRAAHAVRMAERARERDRTELAVAMDHVATTWRQAAQIAREELSCVDIDLRDPTVAALLDGVVTR